MQLGMEGEGPSTSRNVAEEAIVDSDSDEEAVAYRQDLENKIKETKQQINATNDRIRTLESRKAENRCSNIKDEISRLRKVYDDAIRSLFHSKDHCSIYLPSPDQVVRRNIVVFGIPSLSDEYATLKNLTENLESYEQAQQVALASRISAIKTRHKALKQQLAQERAAARQSLEQIQQALQNEGAQERQEWQAAVARERQAWQAAIAQERQAWQAAVAREQQARQAAEQALQREAAQARQEANHTRQQLEQAGEAARQSAAQAEQAWAQTQQARLNNAAQAERTLEYAQQAAAQAREAVRQSEGNS